MAARTPARRSNQPAEQIVVSFHPSWKGMLGWYIKRLAIAFIALVIGFMLWQGDTISFYWLALVAIASIGGVLGIGRLIRQATRYTITTRRVSETSGILNKKTESAFFEEITNTTVEQNLLERLLRIGRVDFDTAGERTAREAGTLRDNYLAFWGCPNPHDLEQMVDDLRFGDYQLAGAPETDDSEADAVQPVAPASPSAAAAPVVPTPAPAPAHAEVMNPAEDDYTPDLDELYANKDPRGAWVDRPTTDDLRVFDD